MAVRRLLRVIEHPEDSKRMADLAFELCSTDTNLRQAIRMLREKAEENLWQPDRSALKAARARMELYLYLIAFAEYVRQQKDLLASSSSSPSAASGAVSGVVSVSSSGSLCSSYGGVGGMGGMTASETFPVSFCDWWKSRPELQQCLSDPDSI
jgi:hypothetical protein